ncbi:MAG: PDDEXK nuclease domain-containing protein [Prevotella sp.]|jgi:predicted nuclease of restriction endonuclease-like (RecB) superfamily|nr:PDDEXK nuclease domain-containing protein [Prevotella sp.]
MIVKQQNFDQLIDNVYQTHNVLQENAKKIINQNLTIRNWLVGCYIVEYEQHGEDRAEYGARLLEEMAKKLKAKGIKGLRSRELNTCRKFYTTYPQILRTLSAKLQENDNQSVLIASINTIEISRTESAISGNEFEIAPELLLSRLSYSHFIELLQYDDPLERLFYEVETIKNNWSVRELERAINTALYVRTGLSKNKEAIIAKFKNQKPAQSMDIIRDPYFLEFLGLEERPEYSESELEQAILDQLQKFLIELGTGFCFEARQKRITFDNTHCRIDLVFYHRILKSHILIDLKIGKFDHSDAGQMNVYLNYYKDNEMSEGDNPPIGLILCGSKGEALAKYATSGMDNQLFVSKFLVQLPDKKVLESFIKKEMGE